MFGWGSVKGGRVWAHRAPGAVLLRRPPLTPPHRPSGHSSGLGYVSGGQARQGHLHGGGTLPGPSLGGRRFAGAQGVAGVPPSSADDDAADTAPAVASVLHHGAATHLVHQIVDLLLIEEK